MRDFDQFARRMRLMYIFRGENNEPHPYHVKSAWEPPIQRSVALSGCDGPTQKLSSFVDKLLQLIAQQQSYLKDTTDFVNFIENTKVPADIILVSMDVTTLYTDIPQEEGMTRYTEQTKYSIETNLLSLHNY